MKLVADLHIHSVASNHAYSTIKEIAEAASIKGLAMIAITDHGPKMPDGPHYYYFGNLHAIPKTLFGVRVLKGIEANVLDWDGNLDLDVERLGKLDVVAAGFHTYCFPGGTVEDNTQAMINVMAGGLVDIIVHPGNPEFMVEPAAVVRAAGQYGVALEINNSSLGGSRKGSYGNCLEIARHAAREGISVVVGSDAHWAGNVGNFEQALELLLKAGIREEQVLNTSVEKIENFLAGRR